MSRWQKQKKQPIERRPDLALINWLNETAGRETFIVGLVEDAKLVSGVLQSFDTLRVFLEANRKSKLSDEFWKAYERLNETLQQFVHAPLVDPNFFYEGEPVHWSLATEESPIALHAEPIRWVLRLMALGTLDKVRKCECEPCSAWYLARLSNQRFCSDACRYNSFASDPKFKAERSAKARELYRLHTSGKVITRHAKAKTSHGARRRRRR
jgi:hypothetical protein